MKFSTLVLSLFAVLMITVNMNAQTTKEEMLADLNKTGGVYYAYPVSQAQNTPAPKGYEAVYVSHYGRHGSRYLISDKDYSWVAALLHKADRAGALSSFGTEVMNRLDTLINETEGRSGDLSPLGVRQHKAIARRMAEAYPSIFNSKEASLTARSTLVPRCILSMAAFCESLKEHNPKLNIVRESSNRYMPYLCYHAPDHGEFTVDGKWKEQYRKFKSKHTNPERLMKALFTDPQFVEVNVNPEDLMWGFYWIASDMQNVETVGTFYDVFTPEELFDLWQCFNYLFYVNDGAFGGNGTRMTDNAIPLIRNIIESADNALSSGKPGADLRFGHDGNLIPLAAALRLKDCDIVETNPDNFYKAFSDWKIAPMAANIQLVFFRNKKNPNDVIVKFMLNEQETSIPIPTNNFPFYNWEDVRNYYAPLINKQ